MPNSSTISFQNSFMAIPFERLRLPKIMFWSQDDWDVYLKEAVCPPRQRNTPETQKYARRQNNIMINNFCKVSTVANTNYPPLEYIEILADAAMKTYFRLWDARNEKNIVYVYKDEIQPFYMCKKIDFFNHLAKIGDKGLLNWREEKKVTDNLSRTLIIIELIGWSDEMYD